MHYLILNSCSKYKADCKTLWVLYTWKASFDLFWGHPTSYWKILHMRASTKKVMLFTKWRDRRFSYGQQTDKQTDKNKHIRQQEATFTSLLPLFAWIWPLLLLASRGSYIPILAKRMLPVCMLKSSEQVDLTDSSSLASHEIVKKWRQRSTFIPADKKKAKTFHSCAVETWKWKYKQFKTIHSTQ